MSSDLDPKFKQIQNSFIKLINNSKNLCEKEIDYEIVKINDNDSIDGGYETPPPQTQRKRRKRSNKKNRKRP